MSEPITRGLADSWGDPDSPNGHDLAYQRALTDAGNADRLVDLHGHDLIYVPGIGWHVWNGQRWEHDDAGELMRRARNVVDEIQEQAATAADEDWGKTLKKHARASGSSRALKAMIEVAQADARVETQAEALDADAWALNTPNGIVDLRTGTLRLHDRTELHTRMTTAAFEPTSERPVHEAFLDRITAGNKDLQRFLQRLAGLTLIGEMLEHKLPILQGGGANGKSTFVGTLMHALGDYAHVAGLDLLMAGRRSVGAASPEVAGLRGRRLVIVSEGAEDGKLAVERVKAITGGDMVTGRLLNANPITFRPTHTVWLQTNHRPRVSDDSEAIWRRLVLVPFKVTIPEAERDNQLERKLRKETDAILAWAVAGAVEFQRTGLDPPPEVRAETEQYRDSENAFAMWLAECTRVEVGGGCKASELLRSYNTWAVDNRADRLSHISISERFSNAGYIKEKRNSGNYYLDIRMVDPNNAQDDIFAETSTTSTTEPDPPVEVSGGLWKFDTETSTTANPHEKGDTNGSVEVVEVITNEALYAHTHLEPVETTSKPPQPPPSTLHHDGHYFTGDPDDYYASITDIGAHE
jgi:putative DNA primase/helicase